MALSVQGLRDLTRRVPRGQADLRRTAGTEDATRGLLLGGVMPLWIGAGLADWYLHRRTRIEDTAGPRESAIHLLMFTETAEELLRCWRAHPRLSALPQPPQPATETLRAPGREPARDSGPLPG